MTANEHQGDSVICARCILESMRVLQDQASCCPRRQRDPSGGRQEDGQGYVRQASLICINGRSLIHLGIPTLSC